MEINKDEIKGFVLSFLEREGVSRERLGFLLGAPANSSRQNMSARAGRVLDNLNEKNLLKLSTALGIPITTLKEADFSYFQKDKSVTNTATNNNTVNVGGSKSCEDGKLTEREVMALSPEERKDYLELIRLTR